MQGRGINKSMAMMAIAGMMGAVTGSFPVSTLSTANPLNGLRRKMGIKGGKNYPFSSARQEARHQRQDQRMVIVNGFELMNRE